MTYWCSEVFTLKRTKPTLMVVLALVSWLNTSISDVQVFSVADQNQNKYSFLNLNFSQCFPIFSHLQMLVICNFQVPGV